MTPIASFMDLFGSKKINITDLFIQKKKKSIAPQFMCQASCYIGFTRAGKPDKVIAFMKRIVRWRPTSCQNRARSPGGVGC